MNTNKRKATGAFWRDWFWSRVRECLVPGSMLEWIKPIRVHSCPFVVFRGIVTAKRAVSALFLLFRGGLFGLQHGVAVLGLEESQQVEQFCAR